MTLQEAIEARHSVRAYKNEPLADDAVKRLEEQIAILNREGQLHMQLILNEPKAFQIGYTKMDLGIAKYHFAIGAGEVNFEWL